ncbi:hypothetical protein QYF36_014087 [Acer negundo]|nr:hypothetical protein QYF36_014087 [Acer negundo]
MDPNSGFCSHTKIFHSLRSTLSLPPPSQPLSATQFVLSLLHSTTTTTTTNFSETPFLINASNGHRVAYSDFLHQTKSLAFSLQKQYSLSKGDVAFILSPNSLQIPSLYFSLLSLGVVIAPANPEYSISELNHQIQLTRPTISFATSHTSRKLPLNLRTILIDSPEFSTLFTQHSGGESDVVVNQSDIAAILHSSATTGRPKGVLLIHGNLIARIAANRTIDPFETGIKYKVQGVSLIKQHLSGAFRLINMMMAASIGETLVLMETSDLEAELEAVHNY